MLKHYARPIRALLAHAALAACALFPVLGNAAESTYPSKPVRVLTGYPPGGSIDIVARVLTDHLTATFGQPFYVEGKPGAAGNLAGGILAASPPDGHTLYVVASGLVAANPDLYANMGFDPRTAFAPVSLLVRLPVVLEATAKLPVADYAQFVAYIRSGAKLAHGSPGIGSIPHLAAELLKTKLGFASDHVVYRGTGPFATAMMQGEVQWAFDVTNTALTLKENGFAKLLAVGSATRYPAFPETPTLSELGLSDFVATTWFALVAPAATPASIVERLAVEVDKGWKIPEVAARLRAAGLDPVATKPQETAKIFAADRAMWGAVVRTNKIQAE